MAVEYYEGIGRRKESTARVRVSPGTGEFIVNEKQAEVYFPRLGDLDAIMDSVKFAGEDISSLDISVLVKGGGATGQRDAVRMGLARAMVLMRPESRPALRKNGFLTRDARIKERKKPGLKRARKAPTYTKR